MMGFASRSLVLERRASPENPSTSLANPAAWLVDGMGGGPTKSGARINESSSLTLSAVWAAVRAQTDAVASLPAITYERLAVGKQRAPADPRYALLHDRPNPEMSAFQFYETLQGHVALWGNGYAEIERNGSGVPIGLWPLLPDRTRAERRNQQKVFITRVGNEDVVLATDRVLHIPGFGYDGLMGHSVIRMARESLGLAKAAEEFGSTWFGNGSRPSGALSSPNKLSDKAHANVRESWDRLHSGLGNSHRVAILEEGLTWQAIGVPPEDAQFLETRKFQTAEIARWFKVPPHMIGDLERSTNNNIEQQSLEFIVHSIRPWLIRWEQAINHAIFDGGREYFVEFLVDALVRGDMAARSQFSREMFGIGVDSINDILQRENRNPVDGGDRRFVPLNMIPLDRVDEFVAGLNSAAASGRSVEIGPDGLRIGPAAETAGPAPDIAASDKVQVFAIVEYRERRSITARRQIAATFVPLLEDVGDVVFSREVNAATRALDKAFRARGVGDFDAWIAEFYATYPEYATERFYRTVRAMSEAIHGEVVAETDAADAAYSPAVAEFVDSYTAKMGEREASASVAQLRKIMSETPPEEVEAALRARVTEWKEKRAKKFAARESARASNALARESYQSVGVTKLKWRTVGKNCALCSRLDGKVAEITGAFLRKGETVDPDDGETEPLTTKKLIRHPPLHGGCDCQISPA